MERVELHLHTKMSQRDGIVDIDKLLEKIKKLEMKAVALTDYECVQAFPEIERYIDRNAYNIKPIYGVEIGFASEMTIYNTTILAKNKKGLKNLYKIVSDISQSRCNKRQILQKSELEQYRNDLLIGSGCELGELYKAILNNKSDEEVEKIAKFYDYLEVQPISNAKFLIRNNVVNSENDLKTISKRIVDLGSKLNKMVVATSNVHYLNKEDYMARSILQSSQGYEDSENQDDLYFRTTEEMLKEFEYLGKEKAYEIVVINTNKVCDMCSSINLLPEKRFYPHIENADVELQEIVNCKVHEIYGEILPEEVKKRLEIELNIILENDYSTIFMIAQKLVTTSTETGHIVGSRGNLGSSLIAYLLGITEINPLPPHYICPKCKYVDFKDYGYFNGIDLPNKKCPNCQHNLSKDGMNIMVETLLGMNGEKEPDIDLNFSGEGRSKAIKYLKEIFGEDKIFIGGTIGTIADKTALNYIEKYSKENNISFNCEEKNDLVEKICGVKNVNGIHPGGFFVLPKDIDIYDFTPIEYIADEYIISTHFDYHFLDITLLKIDLLMHNAYTKLKMLYDFTGIHTTSIPLDDKETMSIFSLKNPNNIGTYGIPEFSHIFVRNILELTNPTTFDELIKISGLSHGSDVWIDNAENLILDKKIPLSELIANRDDIMLYLIEKGISHEVAFKIMYLVYRGKTSQNKEQWQEYSEIMRKNNIPEWYIESCSKIRYLFPKAHACTYVAMAFRLAWYKVHKPKEFYTVYFSNGIQWTSELCEILDIISKETDVNTVIEIINNNTYQEIEEELNLIKEMYIRGIKFLPPSNDESLLDKCKLKDDGIRLPSIVDIINEKGEEPWN